MGLAAKISIAIDAQTATLQKGFDQATASINKLASGMSGSVFSGVMKANVAMAALTGAMDLAKAGVAAFFDSVSRLDKIGDTAERLGMAGSALAALGWTAEQNGASTEMMTQAIQKMTTGIAEAARGAGEAAESLKALGLDAQALQGLAPEQQFAVIADAINRTGNEANQTQLTMKLFGESASELNKVIDLGSAGLAEWGQKAVEAGAASESMIKASQAATDAMKKMHSSWQTFKDNLVGVFVPAITGAIDMLNSAWDSARSGWNRAFGSDEETNPLAAVAKQTAKVVTAHASVKRAMKSVESTAKETAKSIKQVYAEIPKPADWKSEGVAAVTRGSSAGFSAVQDAQRQRQDEERRHKETVQWLAKIVDAQKESAIRVATVSI